MKKAVSLGLAFLFALLCALPAFAAAEGFGNLRRTAEYRDGIFPDVPADAWYRDSVAAVYALGLMRGKDDGGFDPEGSVRLAEAVTLAARLHSLYRTGAASFPPAGEGEEWYRPYVDYALHNGLLDAEAENYTAEATRREFAVILCRALPESALPAVNAVADGEIPDVKPAAEGGREIYMLYRAGVLTGNNNRGTFTPAAPIQRSAAAVIVSRMAYRSLRRKFVLEPRVWPELEAMPAADDSYFAHAAMLGNSLVDGLELYSGLELDYYGETGATVFDNRVDELLQKEYGKVYLEFGINELSYYTPTVMEAYGDLVDRIRKKLPDAELYVMAVTPVTEERDAGGKFTNEDIAAFDEAIRDMCAEKRCWYLDCFNAMRGEDGWLPEDYAGWDGSPHMSEEGYRTWADVIRTYYA